MSGVVVGLSELGDYVTIKLDEPVGGAEGRGFFHRKSRGQDMVSIDDPARVRPMRLAEAQPGGVPEEIVELVRAGKTAEATKRYRALNGATLDQARAAIARLQARLRGQSRRGRAESPGAQECEPRVGLDVPAGSRVGSAQRHNGGGRTCPAMR